MDSKTLLDQIVTLFESLTLKQKIVSFISIFVVVGLLLFLLVFSTKDSMIGSGYSILFDKTNAGDSALIIQQLEKNGIPYKVINEGTIAVPSNMVYKQRIMIAALGIPKDSKVGFEIFDKSEFGATDFEQKIKYLRALEGELSRTIESLQPIDNASVHIAIPKETVFAEHKSPTTASVVLNINRGMNLSFKQIAGIKNLVSSSITNLTPSHVSIVDQNSMPLGDEDGTSFENGLVKSQVKYKKDYERDIEEKIINVLAPIIGGVDKVVARVTIDFDFARVDSTSEVYDPNSVPRSEQTVEEKKEGSSNQSASGVPGVSSNIDSTKKVANNKLQDKYEKNSSTINYEISKKITNTKGEFAKIKRLSVAVVVDGNYKFIKSKSNDAIEELKYKPLSNAKMVSINAIVKQAVGFNQNRGDEVTVSNFEFKPLKKDEREEAKETIVDIFSSYGTSFMPLIKYILAGLLLFIFYKRVISPFSQKMLENNIEEDKKKHETKDCDRAKERVEKFKNTQQQAKKQISPEEKASEDEIKYDVLLDKLKSLSNEKNEEMADLLQAMIKHENDNTLHSKKGGV